MDSSVSRVGEGELPHPRVAARVTGLTAMTLAALLVAASYYVGSEVGFAIRFPSIPTSIVWPPNSILMAALMLIPPRRWWACLLATLAAHILAQSQTSIPPSTMLLLFATNAGMAILGAYAVRRLCGGPPRFGYMRDLVLFFIFAVFVAPFVTTYADAAAVVLTKWGDNYSLVWQARFLSNVLTVITLVPAIVMWAANGRGWLRSATPRRIAEGCLLALGLGVSYAFAYSASSFGPSFVPARLYAPLPFLIWAALRFGAGGVSTSLLAVLLISVSYAMGGRGPFNSRSPAEDIVGLQLFLIAISAPLMVLAAVTEERRRTAEALSRSEEFNRQIVESSSECIKILDLHGSLLYMSPRGQRLLGIDDLRPYLNTPWSDLWGDDGREAACDAVAQARAGAAGAFRSFGRTPDGEPKWWDTVITPIQDERGNVERLLAVSRDISEYKRAEAELSESHRRTSEILESIGDAFYSLDKDFVFTYVNRRTEQFWDMRREELLGKNFLEVFPQSVGSPSHQKVIRAIEVGRPDTFEAVSPIIHRWVEASVYPTGGGLSVYFRDITERKRAEEALRESEERFRNMANHAPVIIWVTEPNGSCTFVSQTWHALTGQTQETGRGFGWAECVHPDDRARALEIFFAANERREPFRHEYRIRSKSGEFRWATGSAMPRFNSQGEFLGYIGSLIDITESKRAAQALEHLTGRLLQLQDEERRRIARELHDTTAQNLLAIVLNLETLVQRASTLPQDFSDAVLECQSLCEQTQAEIRTLSYLLHPPMLDEGGLVLALEWFVDGFSRRSGIHIDFVAPPDFRRLPPQMETALFRVVQESLTNIYRHSGSTTAEIRLERAGGLVLLRITDFGRGMATATGNGSGNGSGPPTPRAASLGVGISGMRERLRQLGGRLEVRSDGAGTSVTAVLPLGKGEDG